MKLIIFLIFVVSVESDRRIIGGKRIEISEAPYLVTIFINNFDELCSGSLISADFVLTAAHCFVDENLSDNYKIRAGSVNKLNGGILVDVINVFLHPEYNKNSLYDKDFALLQLKNGTIFPEVVEFILLPKSDETIETGEMMQIGGWGKTENKASSQFLMGAKVPIYDFDKCHKAYRGLTEAMICAGYQEGKIDACTGDSGSGLKRISDNVLVGVTSFGKSCAKAGYPGVYAKVSSVRNWIHEIASV